MTAGISNMATLSTFIGLPVSIPLGAVCLARATISGAFTVLTKKYQNKLTKVTKLVDIVTSAISDFETSLSKALNNNEIDEREFQVLQDLHLKVVNELLTESETRNQFQNVYWKK